MSSTACVLSAIPVINISFYQVVPVSSANMKSSAHSSAAASHANSSEGLTIRQFYPQGSAQSRGCIRGLSLLLNNLHIGTLGADSVVRLFNRFTLTLENAIKCPHDFDVNAMAFNLTGDLLVTCRCVCCQGPFVMMVWCQIDFSRDCHHVCVPSFYMS